jgi:sensor c-di-GMP phosphodiesterase-like protein
MSTRKRHLSVAIAAMLIAVAFGAATAYFIASAILLYTTRTGLQQYATVLLENDVASSYEARVVLGKLKSSPYPSCSDAAISYFRDLIYQAKYLKDAGVIGDGAIKCSANMGHLTQPLRLPKPTFSQHDGINVYQDLSPPTITSLKSIGLQLGDAYVVFSPYNFNPITLSGMHFVTTESDDSNQQTGELTGETPQERGMTLIRDSQGRSGDTLYSTRCSTLYTDCVTAYISIPEAFQVHHSEIVGNIFLGGFFGAFLGLFCLSTYQSSRTMERQLRRAIHRDKLQTVYQPIVELASRQIVGAEALSRWTNEEGEIIPPDVFIRVAEKNGFVSSITQLVVRHALADFAATLRCDPEFRLNINASSEEFADPSFLLMLTESLRELDVPAQSLTIEITEGSTVRHGTAKEAIRQLRLRGHGVHIDDFGTGYSSLAYLHELSVDAIKIDRSFTQAVGTDAVTGSILPHILAMADELNLGVIVEGVETAEQADYFAGAKNKLLAQGWFFGHPVSSGEFHRLLDRKDT